jgi:hypothetical protein
LLKSHHLPGSYERRINSHLRLKLEAYCQWLYDLPVENSDSSSYATISAGLEFNYVDLINEGKGQNCGVELTWGIFCTRAFYYMLNATASKSIYTALDEVERNTAFNGDYLLNILVGKEFSTRDKKTTKHSPPGPG